MRSRYYCSQAIQPSAVAEIRRWIFLATFCAIAEPALAEARSSVTRDDLKLTSETLAPEDRKYANIATVCETRNRVSHPSHFRCSIYRTQVCAFFQKAENNR
jgi:hypothetical protein